MNLSHFSYAEKIVPYSTNTEECRVRWTRRDKPLGLWVSVDGPDDWPTWCAAEEFKDTNRQNQFRVTLAEDANVLHLQTRSEVLDFTEEYTDTLDSEYRYAIDWHRVAATYPGIIIAPYQSSLRYGPEASWYWGWDVASGCIWDADAISDVSLIRPMSSNGRAHVAQMLQSYTGTSTAKQEWML